MKRLQPHPLDEMTPLERAQAIAEGCPYDRLPCVPFLGEISAHLIGCTNIREYENNPKLIAEGEIASFERYGLDGIGAGPNSMGLAAALGANVIYPEDSIPYIGSAAIDNDDAFNALEPVNPHTNPYIKGAMEALEMLTEAAHGISGVGSSLGGPFTVCAFLVGTDRLLKDCLKKPERVHHLMRIVTDSIKNCVDAIAPLGVGFGFADPVASGSLISPKMYEKFVFSYMKELCTYIYEKTGAKPSLHMCGNTVGIWKYIKQLDICSLSIDNVVDLALAGQELGDYFSILGNVPPVDVIMLGTKDDIFASVKDCVEKGRNIPKGYTIAPGCNIPLGTEIQKVDWFMDAARLYGKYSI
ncbi:uroporphyrinogen decarboxylase family protein [Faecalicatena sp. Marseille-Q4148]|nr:uroporphyrinogen decarboxylase family protein [Faecalicatena sp. Marseille-Q4148]